METFRGKAHLPGVGILSVVAVAISRVLAWDYLMPKAYGEPRRGKDAECL